MGRKPTGRQPHVTLRMSAEERKRVEAYAEKHGISFSEATRKLLNKSLDAEEADGDG